jgi:hypothetical protein
MTNDPLILEVVRLILEQRENQLHALSQIVFTKLYEVGLIQGRLQGLDMAQKAIDEASKQIYEEE